MSAVQQPNFCSADPQIRALLTYLWPRFEQQDAVGALSRHARAHCTPPAHDDQVQYRQGLAERLANPNYGTEEYRARAQEILDSPYEFAYQRFPSVEALRTNCRYYGPNVTMAEFDSALAAAGVAG